MLKAVLFDLWETLIKDPGDRSQPRQAWRTAAVHRVLESSGCDVAAESVHEALVRVSRSLNAMHDEGRDPGALGRVDMFFEQLDHPSTAGMDDDIRAQLLAAIGHLEADHAPHLALGALESLSALKARGITNALVSNAGVTTAPSLRWLLDEYGLRPHLDVLVFSDELALAKPDPAIFRHTLEALGADASECAFVGDSPLNDIAGAQAAGIFAVQVGNRQREGITPDAQIDTLDQLVGTLEAHNLLPTTTHSHDRS